MASAWASIFDAVPARVGAILSDLVVPLGVVFGLVIAGLLLAMLRSFLGGAE